MITNGRRVVPEDQGLVYAGRRWRLDQRALLSTSTRCHWERRKRVSMESRRCTRPHQLTCSSPLSTAGYLLSAVLSCPDVMKLSSSGV